MTACVYGSCWEWVASLPADQSTDRVAQSNDSIVAGSGLVSRRHGVLGLPHGGKYNPSDIFQLAQATRKARERHSVVASSTATDLLTCDNDRATLLRSAYANVQRPSQQLLQHPPPSESSPLSLDSSSYDPFGLLFDNEDEYYPTAEEVLIDLGFGGPPAGIDRVPERFLCPSQMRGVQLDRFFAIEQELDEARETCLGYRGLTGPPSRRPSLIVAKLVEKMMGKSSSPTAASSFECAPLPLDQQPIEAATAAVAPLQPSQLMALPTVESRGTTPASSRRSSLRRQECVELDDLDEQPQPSSGQLGTEKENDIRTDESDSEDVDEQPNEPRLPTVYVTPPPNNAHAPATGSSSSGHEVDSIVACLQLAAEAYRVQLDSPRSDENHNTADVLKDLHRELDRTDELLLSLQGRLLNARSSHEPFSAECLRSALDDMIDLLQQQQRLYRRAADGSRAADDEEPDSGADDESDSQVVQLPSAWVRDLERRVAVAVRKSVRRELLKATRRAVK